MPREVFVASRNQAHALTKFPDAFGPCSAAASSHLIASRSVAVDGIPVVVQTAVREDAEIELRGGVTAFGREPEVPHRAGFHLSLLPNHGAAKLLAPPLLGL